MVKTVDELNLPKQKLDFERLKKSFKHLSMVDAVSYAAQRPRLLIGINHHALCNVQSTKEGGEHEPFAVKMR